MAFHVRLLLVFSLLGCVELITVNVPQRIVNVTVGGSVNLLCTFSTSQPTTNLNVQWTLYKHSNMLSEQVFYYQSGIEVVGGQFSGRVKVLSSPSDLKNASISISDMQPSDAGTYTCEVHNVPDIEGNNQGNVIVNVFEKPSVPFCGVHGNLEAGNLVTLSCHSEKGSPVPTYTWTKVDQGKSRSVKGTANVKTGIMYIRNLTQFEFGEYRCNASNIIGYSTCTIELNHELDDGALAGAVIGALLGACFIVLLVWFIVHKLKKQRYNAAKASAATEMQSRPKSGGDVQYGGLPKGESANSPLSEPMEEEA
ncbi:V-set and immunoglobulin domain-containing protein 1-like [Chanos chanos]|uniref:V-set and immunoglobulin domain-containing protein 1-like n=1 Tax=Chanos chanos TaxID=29144 RepID=UPI0011F185FB|nr:V-set and immunoglobulin domain-containing protein 1 [Chanos chanos]